VGGVLAGVAVLAIAVASLTSSSSRSTPSSGALATTTARHASKAHAKSSGGGAASSSASSATPAAQTSVVVLNGTETTGLAHRVSGELRNSGYSLSTALNGRPPGANQVSVVEYASGHRADAEGVARAVGVSQVQPLEATVSSLSGSATVVVIVGLDKAATVP